MKKISDQMESFTVEQFQMHFDELMERVENGESFVIKSEYGDAVMIPCKGNPDDIDDIVRIYTEHDEGC